MQTSFFKSIGKWTSLFKVFNSCKWRLQSYLTPDNIFFSNQFLWRPFIYGYYSRGGCNYNKFICTFEKITTQTTLLLPLEKDLWELGADANFLCFMHDVLSEQRAAKNCCRWKPRKWGTPCNTFFTKQLEKLQPRPHYSRLLRRICENSELMPIFCVLCMTSFLSREPLLMAISSALNKWEGHQ